jgi:hypothetical protein
MSIQPYMPKSLFNLVTVEEISSIMNAFIYLIFEHKISSKVYIYILNVNVMCT